MMRDINRNYIVTLHQAGWGFSEIARRLNTEGLCAPLGGRYSPAQVSRVVKGLGLGSNRKVGRPLAPVASDMTKVVRVPASWNISQIHHLMNELDSVVAMLRSHEPQIERVVDLIVQLKL